MSQGSGGLRCLKTQVLTSSAGSQLRGKVSECSSNRAAKVQRWKSRKERNSARHKSHKETFQKKAFPRGFLQRCNLKPSSGCSNMGPRTSLKDACNLKQVFITQSRLTQHQGIFNREVKSVDIGRLVNQAAEVEPTKTDIANVTTRTGKSPQGQVILSLDLIPTPEPKVQEAPVSPCNSPPQMLARVPTPISNTQPQEEVERSELRLREDNSQRHVTPPGSGKRASTCNQHVVPIAEAAEDIFNMLSSRSRSLFPGRNLLSETRQSIVEKVRQLCGSDANLTQVSVQRKLDYRRTADAHRYKDPGHEHASDRGRDVRRSGLQPQSTSRQMHTPSVHFLPWPRDSLAHTLIKMVSPEGQHKITDDLRRPVNYGSGYKPSSQCKQKAAENSQNTFNISSSSFCRARRPGNVHSLSLHDNSPPIRWSVAQNDDQTHVDGQNVHSPKETERLSMTSQPLQNISVDQRIREGARVKDTSTFDDHSSIWSCTAQKPPIVKIFDVSSAETRLRYIKPSPHRILSRSHVESQRHVFPEELEDTCLSAPDNFQFEDMRRFRNPKRHTSSQLVTGSGFHQGLFPTKTMPKWRHFQDSWNGDFWTLQGTRHEDWSDGASHIQSRYQQKSSLQQETSFISLPFGRSLRKKHLENSSTDSWLYPRMKLY